MFIHGRYGLAAGLCMLALSLGVAGSCQQAATGPTQIETYADLLQQDIQILYTVNRLQLNAQQIVSLLAVSDRMVQETGALETQRQSAIAAMAPLLEQKRLVLLKDDEPTEELESSIVAAQAKVDGFVDAMATARATHAGEIKQLLSAAQVAIITGADEANSQAEELLVWIRELPAAEFAEEAAANARELADPDSGLTAAGIMQIFTTSRSLTDEQFEAGKAPLVARLAPLYMPLPEAADGALMDWFSNARLAGLLRAKLQGGG